MFDVLGWFSPAVIKVKILYQRLWEQKVDWDDPVPINIQSVWERWRSELPQLTKKMIPRCYYPNGVAIVSMELHGFSDASEEAYAAVVYLRMIDSQDNIHTSLVTSKTRVSPIKKLTIPRLELCGALLLSRLLNHVKGVFGIPMDCVHAWTDSTIVLSWLSGSPKRFKTFVGNRVATIIDSIPPVHWKHVAGIENPADCASRGLYPSEILTHQLWWNGPTWLKETPNKWPKQPLLSDGSSPEAAIEVCHVTTALLMKSSLVVSPEKYSSFERLRRIVAWIIRFCMNCRDQERKCLTSYLTTSELNQAEVHIFSFVQCEQFLSDVNLIKTNQPISRGSCLLPLAPFIDSNGLVRVGGRQKLGHLSSSQKHPIILHGNNPIVKLLITGEHKRLLHGGPNLVISSLGRKFHIIRIRTIARSIIRKCVTCRRLSARPTPPLMGQLPLERLTPGTVFEITGVDYAGPVYIKYGHVRKPVIIKSYISVFVSLSVKAVHLELVTDLSSEAFISCLRRFIARRGYPSKIWSDHGTNFIGANREIKELIECLKEQRNQEEISDFCTLNNIEWKFIPERSPHFGGIWEAAVRSFKKHLKRIVGEVKLTYEEMYTVISQIEACMNSRPLVAVGNDDDGIEVLTPGHFLIGKPLMALPDKSTTHQSLTHLRRWNLCQTIVKHFWKRWSLEYLTTLQKNYRWTQTSRNISVGDVVILFEDSIVSTQWPLARVVKTYPGKDGIVRVVDVKTSKGLYRRPVCKVAVILPETETT